MSTCFIAMPISVRKDLVPEYHGGDQHFGHVLHHLFAPAVEKAGYKPISPLAKGSEMIHGEIISNLQTADLVLCDMSTLNANVFMELGIRTSLNKPVCLVIDDKTTHVPFDTTVLNHHTYSCLLDPWILEKEVPALAEHIVASAKTCAGANPLWKYFGLTATAHPPEPGTTDERLALLASKVENIGRAMDMVLPSSAKLNPAIMTPFLDFITTRATHVGMTPPYAVSADANRNVRIDSSQKPPDGAIAQLERDLFDAGWGRWDVSVHWTEADGRKCTTRGN